MADRIVGIHEQEARHLIRELKLDLELADNLLDELELLRKFAEELVELELDLRLLETEVVEDAACTE